MKISAIKFQNVLFNKTKSICPKISFKSQLNNDEFIRGQKPFSLDSATDEEIMKHASSVLVDSMDEAANAEYEKISEIDTKNIPCFTSTDVDEYLCSIYRLGRQTSGDKEHHLPDYCAQAKFLKAEKYEKLSEIFKKTDLAFNFRITQALNAGFEKNPKKVIDILSDDDFENTNPYSITDKYDVTQYAYSTLSGITKISTDSKSGKYVAFSSDAGRRTYCEFAQDGSIHKLTIKNQYDNSTVVIVPDSQEKSIETTTITNDYIIRSKYTKNETGQFQLTDKAITDK